MWSVSKVDTYNGCKLRYKYQYIQKFVRFPDDGNKWANRGLSFHETVENYTTGSDVNKMRELLAENIKKYNVNVEEFDVPSAFENFLVFWDYFVKPLESEGFRIHKEYKLNGNIIVDDNAEEFVGYADLLCESDNKIKIFDYKVKKAENPAHYRNQLLLYSYLIGKSKGWNLRQISNNIEVYIFYSLMPFDKDNPTEGMLRCMRRVPFDFSDLKNVLDEYFQKSISNINKVKWEEVSEFDGTDSFACNFCPYQGADRDDSIGFGGCKRSILNGAVMDSKYKIIKK